MRMGMNWRMGNVMVLEMKILDLGLVIIRFE